MVTPSKTYEYIVVLKANTFKWIDITTQLMLLLAIASFLQQAFIIKNFNKTLAYSFCCAVIAGWWIYCQRLRNSEQIPLYRFALLVAACGWYIYPTGFYLSILYLIAAVLERPVKLLPEVAIDEDEIAFNTFPQKKYSWNELNNLVMKDGLLTVDFKNNKLYQKEINDEVSKATEKEFNEYCKKMLKVEG